MEIFKFENELWVYKISHYATLESVSVFCIGQMSTENVLYIFRMLLWIQEYFLYIRFYYTYLNIGLFIFI